MSSLENKFSMDGPSGTACTPPYTTEWLQAANDVPWPLARSWVAINSGNMDGAEPAGNGVDVAVPKVLQGVSGQRAAIASIAVADEWSALIWHPILDLLLQSLQVERESPLEVPVCEFSRAAHVNQDGPAQTELIHLGRT